MIVGLIQQCSGLDIDHNLKRGRALAEDAKAQGATWLLYPENAPFLGKDRDKLSIAEPLDGPIVDHYRRIAQELDCFVTIGSVPERSPSPDHTYNTQVVINPAGELISVYRKIHLFDVALDDGTVLKESATILPGEDLVTHTIPFEAEQREATVGLSICYDLRFPELYRRLTLEHGAQIITVPAAFTLQTGRFHWLALLRARAIENQVYILAPNQYGVHLPGRASFGQSVIIDPWGQTLAIAPERECASCAKLDLSYLDQVRERMPCGSHVRLK